VTTDDAAVVEVRGLHRFFRRSGDEVAALRDVSFSVAASEHLAVRGPSGSGKSTLLAMLAGLDRPDAGEVRIDGVPFNFRDAPDPARTRRESIGVLTQTSALVQHLTLADNIRVTARVRRQDAEVGALLDLVGLRHRRKAWPSELSGGETARAGLALALIGTPRLLLADEPTAEISSAEEAELLVLMRSVRPADGATIVVTHSEAVADAADRVLELDAGRLTEATLAGVR
jgi:putative ABC transport system ATP-binding protein